MATSSNKPDKQDTSRATFKQSERWLRALFAQSYSAIVLISKDGTIFFASPSLQQVIGYTAEEYVGRNGAQLTHPDDLEAGISLFRRLREQPGITLSPQLTRFRHKDGSWRWIEYIATNLLSDPAIEAIVFNFRDITESKLAEETQYLLAAIVTSSDDTIVSKTLDGMITSWNVAAERLFGYPAAEAVGKHITLIIPPELYHEEEAIIRQLRNGQRIDHFETVRLRKDGSTVPVSLSISPVRDKEGKVIGAAKIARDITERLLVEQRKDEFIGMASHELKTPVTSLKGFTTILQRHLSKQGDDQGLAYLAKMDRQITKLTSLISELLDISRMQSGKLSFQDEAFDLFTLVEEIVETLQQTTQTHHLYLESTEPVQVVGDRERLGQVLINLITNAIKYSPQGDKIMIQVGRDQTHAVVSVQDFGIGIAREHQQHIFERFYQVIGADGQTYPGLGIGLFISHEIISRHRGRIWVESSEGIGSTFYMSLPLAQEVRDPDFSDKRPERG
ncbi:MAG TPA: PAS domain-containing sensor histidine kinase [Ktedonobacteraceae bacterium]|nr:PAS domain-containing sensor histidine kinase [Ktedonobacteraceae bacterium]